VVIGLFVYAFLSRRGILGHLGMLYTPWAIVVGQVILILPWVTTFTLAAVSRIDARYRRTAMTLGAGPFQTSLAIAKEARFGILAAIIAAFGRVIAEIGIAMMLGGNIKGFTRTMTTAMALEHNKGEFVLAVALGVVLLTVSLVLNTAPPTGSGEIRSEPVSLYELRGLKQIFDGRTVLDIEHLELSPRAAVTLCWVPTAPARPPFCTSWPF
jgi:ABC-type tungstate transport system substrate-binding protein